MHPSILKLLSNLAPFLLFYLAYIIDHAFSRIYIYPIYLVPILWISSKFGWQIGSVFAILGAALSTPISPHVAMNINQQYLDQFIARSITLTSLSALYSNYISLAATHKKRYRRLSELVNQCPDCGSILCQDGQWRTLEELISNPNTFGKKPNHDDCANRKNS